jgi:hypothetical protein
MSKIWRSWWEGSFKPGRKKPIKDFIEKSITTLKPPQLEEFNNLKNLRKSLERNEETGKEVK